MQSNRNVGIVIVAVCTMIVVSPHGWCADPTLRMFIDDKHIAAADGIQRTLQQPQKLAEPVIRSSGPWEANPYLFGTVIFDKQEQIYKAWYQSYNFGVPVSVRTPFLYATSQNGRDWTKPDLGLFDFNGSKQNNIVFQNSGFHDSYSLSVIKEPNETDVARRYKMTYWDMSGPHVYGDGGMMIAVSPDGIHWSRSSQTPVLHSWELQESISDVIDTMYDPVTGKFVTYAKGWANPFPDHRQVVRTESTDLVNWSTPEVVIRHEHTLEDPQSYGMPVFEYEGVYLGLIRSYKNPGDETINVQLAMSHDNRTWRRVADNATFLPTGESGQWDDGMIFVAPPVVRDNVVEFFYGGWDGPHDVSRRDAAIGLATLTRDRFVAVSATKPTATLQTTKFSFEAGELNVNADATEGRIRVALFNADGEVIPGFGLDDSVPITADVLQQPLQWNGSADLSSLAGRELSLLFEIQAGAKLFAYRTVPVPEPSAVWLIGAGLLTIALSRQSRSN